MRSDILVYKETTTPIDIVPQMSSGLNPTIENLLSQYFQISEKKTHTGGSTIHVDEIASQIAKVYEQLRKIIDWKEQNLLLFLYHLSNRKYP